MVPLELCNYYFGLILLFNGPSMLVTVVELNIKGFLNFGIILKFELLRAQTSLRNVSV